LVAPHPPLDPPDCLGASEARHLFGLRGAHPRDIGLLVGDPVHRLEGAVQRQRGHSRSETESTHPSRRSGLKVQGEEKGEQPREQDRHGHELAEVHGRPDPAAGVLGERGGVVVRNSIGVEQCDDDVQELSHEQQRGRQAQRRAVDHGRLRFCFKASAVHKLGAIHSAGKVGHRGKRGVASERRL
jgi:hypothetical protein